MDSRKGALAALRKNLRGTDDSFSPVKEVKVMADSKEGLEEGLSKAKELMESGAVDKMAHEAEEIDESMEDESEHKEYSDEDLAMMSREELIECIKKMRDEESEEDEY